MANVNVEGCFEQARAEAASGNLVVVRRDGDHLLLPALRTASVAPGMVASIKQMMPSSTKRRVAVIADTIWATSEQPSLQAASQAIPFWGLLMGFASIGRSVWVFDGAVRALSAGCRGADVLIVDSASLTALPANWQAEVAGVMRNTQILVHDRGSYRLLPAS